MNYLQGIKTIVFDLDGTIYFKDKSIKGSKEVLHKLRKNNFNLRFVTNTDSSNRETILQKLRSYNISPPIEEIFTCSTAALRFLEQQKNNKCFLLCSNDVRGEFDSIPQDETNPNYVVIGDFRDIFIYENINKAFKLIMNGAEMIAMQNSLYFYTANGINIDTGSFVYMFEHISNKKAIVVGKPSKEFFELAIIGTNSKPSETLVIGDDINTDIIGAKNFGANSILVKTGKFKEESLSASKVKPDYLINSIADLI